MKAVVCPQYGPPEVLTIQSVSKPVPADHEVLIKIHATTAHVGDTRIRRADPFMVRFVFGLFKPQKNLIPGLEVSGVVEAVGEKVTDFKPGDQVFALTGFNLGGYAEYICLPDKSRAGSLEKKGMIAHKPTNLSYAEAATIPAGGLTALKNLQKAQLQAGQKILINGASGSLGTFAIQL
ncbi:MAG: NAD(P)-dependent alcohol dehydrogenase, partial [Bacteroidota bacterium]